MKDQTQPETPEATEAGLEQVFEQAAQLSLENDIDLEDYMTAAWEAYVDARPGFRDALEFQHTLKELAELRRLGKIGQA